LATRQPGNVVAAVDDALTVEAGPTPDDVGTLSTLERYRLLPA